MTKQTERRLVRVRRNQHYHWPDGYGSGEFHYRGGEGYVIDLDAPFEEDWIVGQEFKVEPVPEAEIAGAEPGEIKNPRAISMLREKRKEEGLAAKRAQFDAGEVIEKNQERAADKAKEDVPPKPDPEPEAPGNEKAPAKGAKQKAKGA